MARKEFKILIAIGDRAFASSVSKELRKTYTVQVAKDVGNLSSKIHHVDFDLIIIDYRFSGMKAEDIYQGVELLHPKTVFVIYTHREKKEMAARLWKRRALDYITHTRDVYSFLEEVHKCVRWAIQKAQVGDLRKKIDELAETIQSLSQKIEQAL